MSDLRTLLHETAGPSAAATSTAVADAHLASARRSLHRRNARRVSLGSSIVAAAAIGAFAITGTSSVPTPPSAGVSTAPSTTTSSVELVAYEGAQPTGYTLDQVPAGWQIDHDDLSLLTLAPAGTASGDGEDGSVSLEGRIAISTQSSSWLPRGVQLDDVQVAGRAGVIAHMDGGGDTRTLFVEQPSGDYLEIQVWSGLGWDNAEIAAFAESVHVNPDAVPVVG
jgi:hypothetical protein